MLELNGLVARREMGGARRELFPTNSLLEPRVSQPLRYLKVKFQRDVQGNLHSRYVEARRNVKAIYGPVDSWQQRLVRSRRDGPGKDTIWISSDKLRVGEDPMARVQRAKTSQADDLSSKRLGPMQLSAAGNVVIEGHDPQRGEFTATGDRATYDQQKTMFVLVGNGRKPATLTHQQYPGSPPSENSFQKIIYWQSTGDWNLEGGNLQWNQVKSEARVGRREGRGTLQRHGGVNREP